MGARISTGFSGSQTVGSVQRRRRQVAVLGAAAVAVVGGLGVTGRAARADITGFAGFAPVNSTGTFTTPPSYSSDGTTFNTTDGNGNEAVTGFYPTAQLVTSFDATFNLNVSAGATPTQVQADGASLIFMSPSNPVTSVGATGSGLGYTGIANSASLGLSTFGYQTGTSVFGYTEVGTGGVYPTNQANGQQTTTVFSSQTTPETIRVNVAYSGTTLLVTSTNLTTKVSANQTFTNFNIPSAVGGNTALIGIGAATGGLAENLSVTGFKYVTAASFSSISLTAASFNEDVVVEASAPQSGAVSKVSASMDQGSVNPSNNTWYEKGYDLAAPTTGLPGSGSTFVSQDGNQNHVFKMQSYTGNNVLLVGNSTPSNTGTMTFTTPTAYRALSFLTASGNGPELLSITINYSDGHASDVLGDVVSPDWFGTGQLAYDANGRVVPGTGTSSFNAQNSGNPNLWESDVALPDSTDPIASVTITNDAGGGRAAIFGISGATNAVAGGALTYTGAGTPAGSFDTNGSLNFQTGGTPAAFNTGSSVVFDDTATGPTTIAVQSAGVSPNVITFNNNAKNYTFNGGPITGLIATLNGGASVTFNDAVTLPAGTTINSGTLVIGGTGSLNSSTITIAGGTLVVASGGTLGGGDAVADAGTLTLNTSSATVGALTGAGTVNLTGTALMIGTGSAFTGTFAGTGNNSLNISGGSVTVSQPGQFAVFTGGVSVGVANGSSAFLTFSDNSGTFGLNGTTPLTLTLGPSGTLATPYGTDATFAGNIVLATGTGTGTATIATGGSGSGNTLTLSRPITGTGPLALTGGGGITTIALEAASTYTGETQLSGTIGSANELTVRLDADNALPTTSGIAYTNAADIQLDLNGHNQSVAYLRGSSAAPYPLTNSNGSSPAVLTINSGTYAGAPASFGTPIVDSGGTGSISVVKTGTGNQIFTAANAYSGGTTITGGTLTTTTTTGVGSGPVTLNGGKLGLSGGTPQLAARLSGFSTFQVTQGGATGTTSTGGTTNVPFVSSDNSTLFITSDDGNEGNSAFSKTPVTLPTAGFYANFTYQNDQGADGIAFVLQNDPRGVAAVGGSGGALGYGAGAGGPNNNLSNAAITNSAAVQFNIYGNGGTGFGTNGAVNDSTAAGSINLGTDTNPLNVVLSYNPASLTLTEMITDSTNSSLTGTFTYNVNLATVLGGGSAYLGFTGGTGGAVSLQTISNFTYGSLAPGSAPVSIANAVVAAANTSSGIELNVTSGNTSAAIGSLNLSTGSRVTIDSVVTGTATRGVLIIPSLTFAATASNAPSAVLDVGNNDLDLPNTSVSAATALVKAGYANGTFNGSGGITSSTALANVKRNTAVGVIANTDATTNQQLYGSGAMLGLFDGANPAAGDTLVKYTYFGDANLDGVVNGADYARIDAGFLSNGSLAGWYNGDFNYDGKVDASDYTLIDNAFNTQDSPFTSSVAIGSGITATSTDEIAPVAGTSAVPEPATLGLLAVAAGGLLARRRRAC